MTGIVKQRKRKLASTVWSLIPNSDLKLLHEVEKKTFYAISFFLAAERIEKMELLSLLPPTIIPRDYTYDDVCMTSDFSQPSTTKLKLIQHDSDNNFLCYIIFFEWEREWRCSFDLKIEVGSVVTQTQFLRFFTSYLFFVCWKNDITFPPWSTYIIHILRIQISASL